MHLTTLATDGGSMITAAIPDDVVPSEAEGAVHAQPAVSQATVVGELRPRWDVAGSLFVVLRGDRVTDDGLRTCCPERCSLVFGHPHGPTGLRSIAELIETLRVRGGGAGRFTGCAAGDTGAALILEVADR